MDRLKKEWEEVQIPEEVRVRARNLAWSRVQNPIPGIRRSAWVAAISTTAIVILLLASIRNGEETHIRQATAPSKPEISRPTAIEVSSSNQPVKPALPPKSVPVGRSAVPKQQSTVADRHDRVVLNFKLPESGARMIWIMDSRFQLDGDTQ